MSRAEGVVSKILKINDMAEVLKCDAVNFFFDLEDTIFAPNLFYDKIREPEFGKVLLSIAGDMEIQNLISLGRNRERRLMDKRIPHIIKSLEAKGCKIFALTSGYPSRFKVYRLRELNIRMSGFLWTRGQPKGGYLVKFLNKYEENLTGNCCFVDNHLEKIENVKASFDANFTDRKLHLYLYEGSFNGSISIDEFRNYWIRVAEEIKEGRLYRPASKNFIKEEKDLEK